MTIKKILDKAWLSKVRIADLERELGISHSEFHSVRISSKTTLMMTTSSERLVMPTFKWRDAASTYNGT